MSDAAEKLLLVRPTNEQPLFMCENGQIKQLEEVVMWCVFNYNSHEDATQIVGRHPLWYHSYEQMREELDGPLVKDLAEWKKNGIRTVIRPVKIMRAV